MHSLNRHPDSPASPVEHIAATVQLREGGILLRFRATGDIARVAVPDHAPSERADELWRTTCFELFWQGEGRSDYTEINVSPSSRWAAWHFGAYRGPRQDAAVPSISISSARSDRELILEAHLAIALPLPARIAPTAVIEAADGSISYWAPAFAPGKPDFHAAECRILTPEPE